ncbi:UDP-N-acetylmuramate dehydrogenase [Candidatus Latescibacterota bacterium]
MITKLEEPIASYTHYRIGGIAREAYFPETTDECAELCRTFAALKTPHYILGGGSNVLVGDGYWDGAVILTGNLREYIISDASITSGAGLESSKIAEIALQQGKTGLEFLHLLPGSIGGAVAGNARYDNTSVSDVLEGIVACHPEVGIRKFEPSAIRFAYKHTSIVTEGWFICEVTLRWRDGESGVIRERMREIERKRTDSRHFDYPSAGCIFKNDHARNIQAGRLLDSLGLKGMRVGDAEVAGFHANFIVNRGSATARDVLTLIERIESIVRERTGIVLDRELKLAGTFT